MAYLLREDRLFASDDESDKFIEGLSHVAMSDGYSHLVEQFIDAWFYAWTGEYLYEDLERDQAADEYYSVDGEKVCS